MHVGTVVVCLIACCAIVGCAFGGPEPAEDQKQSLSPGGYAGDSPEGTLDAYMAAMTRDDVDSMWTLHGKRLWAKGDTVTYEQFVAANEDVHAYYRGEGAPSEMPFINGHTVLAPKPFKYTEFLTGEALEDVHAVGVLIQTLVEDDGEWVYREATTAYLVWQQDGRWVVTNIDSGLP